MSAQAAAGWEPRIIAYVCNWCTYLGADLAGTNRLEYPANVRIIRLPCTGRIDFNLIVKAFEIGADSVLVSGCHPGDCHYTSGNFHARRRWMVFRPLLETLGFDLNRLHFTWISAAEGRKFQQVITDITEKTRALGPYRPFVSNGGPMPERPASGAPAARGQYPAATGQLRARAKDLLESGAVKVVIGYGPNPVFVTKPEDVDRLQWNGDSLSNLAVYLKRKEVRALGKPAIVVKACDERALVVLEKESQIDRGQMHVIGMACEGMGQRKCETCQTRVPKFADEVIGAATAVAPRPAEPEPLPQGMAYWAGEFERCIKCYACRSVCPLCYCERCQADKNRPQAISTSATLEGNFAWHIMRAFHLAGRCIGCDECARACPVGIDLGSLNRSVARAVKEEFGFTAGADPEAEPVFGRYLPEDKERFIG